MNSPHRLDAPFEGALEGAEHSWSAEAISRPPVEASLIGVSRVNP
jgi:hypothetical protein